MIPVRRRDVLRFRFRRHQLDRDPGSVDDPQDVALLDYGVQDTGVGMGWALAVRGVATVDVDALALCWTLRGAPHAYRRRDLLEVAVATSPFSEDDAAKRVIDASKPLSAAGIAVLDALRVVAGHLRTLAEVPIAKGEASGRLTALLGPPYLRWCRPCGTTHVYEQPFRLAALQAGLELAPGTSPPVLRRIEGLAPLHFSRSGTEAEPRYDVVRNHLRFFGPARPRDVAAFLDAPLPAVKAHWPSDSDAATVTDVDRSRSPVRSVLSEDADELRAVASSDPSGALRLLGPYDPYLQLRDRDLLVADPARRKELWPVLGRPGAIVVDGEILGTWRPRTSGRKLSLQVQHWAEPSGATTAAIEEQAERYAASRQLALSGVTTG